MNNKLKQGQLIFFAMELLPFVIKAINGRYAVCTRKLDAEVDKHLIKHHGIKKREFTDEVVYTILDFEEEVKGPNNLIFNPYDYKDQKDIEQSLVDLQNGEYEISRRHGAALVIDWQRTNNAALELS